MPANREAAAKTWWFNLEALTDFVRDAGRLPRQRERHMFRGTEVAVGRWLMHQRQRGLLDDEQQRALADVTGDHPASRDEAWEHHRQLVIAYQSETGEPPVKGTVYRGAPIGQWQSDQRKAHARGTLSAERTAALEDIPGWTWTPTSDDFELGFAHFESYRNEHGTGWVPVRYVCADGFALGSWARDRRRHRKSETPERTQRLLAAGFVYDTPEIADRPRVVAETDPVPATRHARGSANAWARRRESS